MLSGWPHVLSNFMGFCTISAQWKFLATRLPTQKRAFRSACALGISSTVFSLVPWVVLGLLIDLIRREPGATAALGLVALISLFAVARIFLMGLASARFHLLADNVSQDLREQVLNCLRDAPLSRIEARGGGAIIESVLRDVERIENFSAHNVLDLITTICLLICAALVLFYLNWSFALVVLALPVIGLALLHRAFATAESKKNAAAFDAAQEELSARSMEFIRGLAVIRFFDGGGRSKSFVDHAINQLHALETRWVLSALTPYAIQRATTLGCVVLAVALGGWLFANGTLSLSAWIVFVCLAPAITEPLDKLARSSMSLMEVSAGVDRIADMLRWPKGKSDFGQIAYVHPGQLIAQDLKFELDGHAILKGGNLTEPDHGLTVIVGRTGSGKSTLIRLLGQFDEPTSGSILYGQHQVTSLAAGVWEQQIGFSFQETFLKSASVADNLRMGDPSASIEQLETACAAAGALEFVNALPERFDTKIGGDGWPISKGQEQRLALARVLLRAPNVLFLDEALAHVDLEHEDRIIARMAELRCDQMTVMISHRLKTATHADHVIVMDEGRVAGEGRHDALTETCPAYRALWGLPLENRA